MSQVFTRRLCRLSAYSGGLRRRWFASVDAESGKVTGVVKSWKGRTGIVTTESGTEAIVFQDKIVAKCRPKFRSLYEGTDVEFVVKTKDDGKGSLTHYAQDVTQVGGEPFPRYRHYDAEGNFILRPSWKKGDSGNARVNKITRRVGKVLSTKMDKTAVVEVIIGTYPHPKYGKYITKKKSYACHDPKSQCRFGDVVEIESCKPMSKIKSHKIVGIVREENYIDREDPNRLVTLETDLTES
eukprot:g3314.t1